MLPVEYGDVLTRGFQTIEQPTLSYRLRFDGEASSKQLRGAEAMKQAIFLILHTERFIHAVYSWNYGVEFADLIGEAVTPYLQARMQQAIEAALLADDRIWKVDDFSFVRLSKKSLLVRFIAHTTQGDVASEYRWEGGAGT